MKSLVVAAAALLVAPTAFAGPLSMGRLHNPFAPGSGFRQMPAAPSAPTASDATALFPKGASADDSIEWGLAAGEYGAAAAIGAGSALIFNAWYAANTVKLGVCGVDNGAGTVVGTDPGGGCTGAQTKWNLITGLLQLLVTPPLAALGVWGVQQASPLYTSSYLWTWLLGAVGELLAVGVDTGLGLAAPTAGAFGPNLVNLLVNIVVMPVLEVFATIHTREPAGGGGFISRLSRPPPPPFVLATISSVRKPAHALADASALAFPL